MRHLLALCKKIVLIFLMKIQNLFERTKSEQKCLTVWWCKRSLLLAHVYFFDKTLNALGHHLVRLGNISTHHSTSQYIQSQSEIFLLTAVRHLSWEKEPKLDNFEAIKWIDTRDNGTLKMFELSGAPVICPSFHKQIKLVNSCCASNSHFSGLPWTC